MVVNNRSDIVNKLIADNNYTRYLEIGVRDNKNFNRIIAAHKDGVDPAGKCNYVMTSDEFFEKIPAGQTYDIIFIDGLHLAHQVIRDIDNSLAYLNRGGAIVLHDCSPIKKEHASKKYTGGTWNGTVWEGFAEFRFTRTDLSMCVVDIDCGCGVVSRGHQEILPRPDKLDFDYLQNML